MFGPQNCRPNLIIFLFEQFRRRNIIYVPLRKFQGIYIQFESKVTVKLSINIAIGTQYVRM